MAAAHNIKKEGEVNGRAARTIKLLQENTNTRNQSDRKVVPSKIEEEPQIEYIASEWKTFKATAYCKESRHHICNDGDASNTSTGTTPTVGRTIAVDPKVIPYGSIVEVKGYGIYVAEDCGGTGVKGKRIDILFETHKEALEFGRKTLKIRILKEVK